MEVHASAGVKVNGPEWRWAFEFIAGQWREVMMLLKIQRDGLQRERARERVYICLLSSFMTLTTRPVFTDVWAASVSTQKQRWHRTHMHPTLSPYPRTTFPAQGHGCALKEHSDLAVCSSLHAIFLNRTLLEQHILLVMEQNSYQTLITCNIHFAFLAHLVHVVHFAKVLHANEWMYE